MTFKRYKSGDRRISAGDMNARAGAIEGLLQSGGPGSFFDGAGHQVRRVVYDDGSGTPLTLARLTAHAVITAANKSITVGGGSAVTVETAWTYGGDEATLDTADMTHDVVSGGLAFSASDTGGSSPTAIWNPGEANATTAIVGGITMNTAAYPAGHRPRPIDASGTSNTHSHNPLVWVMKKANSAGVQVWQIVGRVAPLHDGTCP